MLRPLLRSIGFLAIASAGFAIVTPIAPTEQSIYGNWIGFTSEANDFYRIVLKDDGGFFASSFSGEEAKLYKIESWKLEPKGQLKLRLVAISTNAYPVVVTGLPAGSRIQLKVSGPGNGWVHEVVLYREQLIEDRINLLRQSMRKQ